MSSPPALNPMTGASDRSAFAKLTKFRNIWTIRLKNLQKIEKCMNACFLPIFRIHSFITISKNNMGKNTTYHNRGPVHWRGTPVEL
mgnify:CR=1 FL=1